jgi:nucleotide-binding universal stress UspA family protein
MVISKENNTQKTNYLVCINAEEYSEVALHFTCYLAKKNKGSIVLLHAIEPADYQSIGIVAQKMRKERLNDSQKLLTELASKAKEWSGIIPIVMVREGFIEEEIISVVEEDISIKMLITGVSQESSKKSRIIPPLVSALGSKLRIPMLIVPGSITKQQMEEIA